MKEAGKGGEYKKNRRRHSRRRGEDAQVQTQGRVQNPADGSMKAKAKLKDRNKGKSKKSAFIQLINDGKLARKTQTNAPRPKWVAPKAPDINLAPTECVWCGKPIDDFSTALSDPASGQAGHFDCAVSRLSERERLETGDTVGYIGGGRFGVINFENAENPKTFRIKKILEWESTEARSEWRNALSEHFSVT